MRAAFARARLAGGLLALVSFGAEAASPWTFTSPESVTPTVGTGVFHHLESAGRKNIAVSDGTVAVAWEDNRDRTSDVWMAWREGAAWSDSVR